MAPTRMNNPSNGISNKSKGKRPPHKEQHAPGVQKIKAALRQTKRLLSKDNLAADVRVETERRLKSLEADLARAETSRKERTFARRYHKVKFFERQKIIRKIEQIKKQLSSSPENPTLLQELFNQRVYLNYILHYPKLTKYISLFPPEVRSGEQVENGSQEKTEQERQALLDRIRNAMLEEELPAQPEVELGSKGPGFKKGVTSATSIPSKQVKKRSEQPTPISEKDEFFEEDDSEDDGEEKDKEEEDSS